MFCKNCGREIDRETLEKLMKPSGETALCPNCGMALDTAEFCGGFWGLIASGQAMNGGAGRERKGARLSGVTEADRLFARMILEDDGAAGGAAGPVCPGSPRLAAPACCAADSRSTGVVAKAPPNCRTRRRLSGICRFI